MGRFGRAQLLGQLQALDRVVGRAEDVVGELADVLDQALALFPERARVGDHLLGVLVGVAAQDLGLALGARSRASAWARERDVMSSAVSWARWRMPAVSSPSSSSAF